MIDIIIGMFVGKARAQPSGPHSPLQPQPSMNKSILKISLLINNKNDEHR